MHDGLLFGPLLCSKSSPSIQLLGGTLKVARATQGVRATLKTNSLHGRLTPHRGT